MVDSPQPGTLIVCEPGVNSAVAKGKPSMADTNAGGSGVGVGVGLGDGLGVGVTTGDGLGVGVGSVLEPHAVVTTRPVASIAVTEKIFKAFLIPFLNLISFNSRSSPSLILGQNLTLRFSP